MYLRIFQRVSMNLPKTLAFCEKSWDFAGKSGMNTETRDEGSEWEREGAQKWIVGSAGAHGERLEEGRGREKEGWGVGVYPDAVHWEYSVQHTPYKGSLNGGSGVGAFAGARLVEAAVIELGLRACGHGQVTCVPVGVAKVRHPDLEVVALRPGPRKVGAVAVVELLLAQVEQF